MHAGIWAGFMNKIALRTQGLVAAVSLSWAGVAFAQDAPNQQNQNQQNQQQQQNQQGGAPLQDGGAGPQGGPAQ